MRSRAATCAVLVLLAGAASAQGTPGRTFRLATSSDAATLDPHATNALFT